MEFEIPETYIKMLGKGCELTWYGSGQNSAVGICDESDELWESITRNFLDS
jgi:hypothetical protein